MPPVVAPADQVARAAPAATHPHQVVNPSDRTSSRLDGHDFLLSDSYLFVLFSDSDSGSSSGSDSDGDEAQSPFTGLKGASPRT